MENIKKSLEDLDRQIESAKRNVAVAEGRQAEYDKQLKENFKLNSLSEAEKFESKEKSELAEMEAGIKSRFAKLKEEYEW